LLFFNAKFQFIIKLCSETLTLYLLDIKEIISIFNLLFNLSFYAQLGLINSHLHYIYLFS